LGSTMNSKRTIPHKKHFFLSDFVHEVTKNRALYLLCVPGIAFFIIFAYIPMAGAGVAFMDFKANLGIFRSPWVGFANFKFLFASDQLRRAVVNTLVLNSIFIITGHFLAIMTAMFLNEIKSIYFKKITQNFIFLPYFVSWIVVSAFTMNLFAAEGGLANNVLHAFGVAPVSWNQRPELWPFILTLFANWKAVGFLSIVYLAVITGISPEYYESSEIDGATKWKQMMYITFPMLVPTITVMMLISIGRIFFADFGMIYGLVGENSALFPTTDVIDTFVFRALRTLGDVGMSSAAGLFQSVIGFILVLGSNLIVRKFQKDSALY
jgi:putative aldouronate transport system permease protein